MDNIVYLSINVLFDYQGFFYVLLLKILNKIYIIVIVKWLNVNIIFIYFLKCKS